jgi:hypothetical protein
MFIVGIVIERRTESMFEAILQMKVHKTMTALDFQTSLLGQKISCFILG